MKGGELEDRIDDDDDAEDLELTWYYSAADEEELRQERELWKWLLTNDENGKISDLFKELVDDRVSRPRGLSVFFPAHQSAHWVVLRNSQSREKTIERTCSQARRKYKT